MTLQKVRPNFEELVLTPVLGMPPDPRATAKPKK